MESYDIFSGTLRTLLKSSHEPEENIYTMIHVDSIKYTIDM